MGRQVNFFLTPEDFTECLSRVQKRGSIVIFRTFSPENRPDIIDPERFGELHKVEYGLGLARVEDLEKVAFRYVPNQEYFSFDEGRSLAIELVQCKINGNIMKRGRLYYTSSFYQEGVEIEKDTGFVAWAQWVLRAAVRGLNRDPIFSSAYVGPHAERLCKEGKLELSQF